MKSIILLTVASVSLFAMMACKKDTSKKMTVIKDCTGSYLRADGKDYQVCNSEKLEAFTNNTVVIASYKKVSDCPQQKDKIVCMMYHENEGWIEVEKIK